MTFKFAKILTKYRTEDTPLALLRIAASSQHPSILDIFRRVEERQDGSPGRNGCPCAALNVGTFSP